MDKASYESLYLEMLPGLYRLAQSLLRHPADAQDAVQQAVLKAWQKRAVIRQGAERAYIARIVINECRNVQRHRVRTVPVETVPEVAYTPADGMLREAMDALPENLRIPLLLRYMEGYSEKEAAETLAIPLTMLKGRLYRARRRLAKELKEEAELE